MIQMELCDDITKKTWNSGNKRTESPRGNKNKIYCMLILHQIKLMTSNGFCILLILLEKIEERNSATWEGLPQTTGRIGKNEWIKVIIKENES